MCVHSHILLLVIESITYSLDEYHKFSFTCIAFMLVDKDLSNAENISVDEVSLSQLVLVSASQMRASLIRR